MKKWLIRAGALTLVMVMALGVIGTAAAQGPGDGGAGGLLNPQGPRDRIGRALMQAVIDATGMTGQDVLAEMRDGKTLSDILTEQGVDPQTVIDTVTAQVTEQVDQRVADGTITEEQAATILEALGPGLETALTASLPERPTPIRDRLQNSVENTLLGVLAEMAGVEPGDVVRDALTPPTLAEIATQYGLDADAIISEAETRITDEMNQTVADGTITEDQAAALLDGLHDRLVSRFDAPLGQFGAVRDRIGDRMQDRFPNMPRRPDNRPASPIL